MLPVVLLSAIATGCNGRQVGLPYVGQGPADREVCLVGCEWAPSTIHITTLSAVWNGPDTILVKGTTTGDIAARTTRFELRTTPQNATTVRTLVADDGDGSMKHDIGTELTVPRALRPTQRGRTVTLTVYETATVGNWTRTVKREVYADASFIDAQVGRDPMTAAVGESTTRKVWVRALPTTNDSSAATGTIRHLRITGPDASSFGVAGGDTCSGFSDCTVALTFLPESEGTKSATLEVDSTSPYDSRFAISGVAGPAPPPQAVPTVRPAGAILNLFENAVFTITNPTTAPITVELPRVLESSKNAFFHPIVGSDPSRDCFFGGVIQPGQSCDVTASFAGAPDGETNPWAKLTIPITGGPTFSVQLFGIPATTGGTSGATIRRPKPTAPVRAVFNGRFRTNATAVPGSPAITRTPRVTTEGAFRATAHASTGVRVPVALRRLLRSRFAGRGSLAVTTRQTTINAMVLTRPARSGRICARMRVQGTRKTARGRITVLGGTGTAGRLRGRLSFQIFRGDLAAGVATVQTARRRAMPPACRTLLKG